eukprot:snap_masked-scaffold_11-processed-gene-3.24-mRNA-1 protein AED:1.00 eAED:1.00 QI:0/-1/0/0/-1/1/1/0/99
MVEKDNINKKVLPQYFPLIDKQKKCEKPAKSFFSCFSNNSLRADGSTDINVGDEALVHCQELFKAYKDCMDKIVGKKEDLRLVRAPKAYLDILAKEGTV